MKPNTAKPSDGMQYFTPELYLRFNSTDDAVADQAQSDWETAITAYQNRLQQLGDRLPAQIRELSETCLHDANLLKAEFAGTDEPSPAVALLTLQHERKITALVYLLADNPIPQAPDARWPLSPQSPHWLYDEVDTREGGGFVQRILFSSGLVLTIPFRDMFMHTFEESPSQPSYRQTA